MTIGQDTREQLRVELRRILMLLRAQLSTQRQAGRGPRTDPLRGVAIEEGEAEALVAQLDADLERPTPAARDPAPLIHGRFQGVGAADESPLSRVSRVFRLASFEFDALILAIAVELDNRFARLIAYLNDHIARPRPTVGLVLSLSDADVTAVEFALRPAVSWGLLLLDGDGPLSALALRVAPELIGRIVAPAAAERLPVGVRLRTDGGPRLDQLVISAVQRQSLQRWADQLRSGSARPLVLAGPRGSGRATAAQSASSSAGLALVEVDWTPERPDCTERLGVAAREALWREATLLVRVPGGTRDVDLTGLWGALAIWELPLALALPTELVEPACAAARVEPAVVHLEGMTIQQRTALWQMLLPTEGEGPGAKLSDPERFELATRYEFLPGTLARAVRRAISDCVLMGDGRQPDFDALSRACRAVGTVAMGPIAQRLAQPYSRDDLVLPQRLLDELDLAAAWMRNRRRVFEQWGFGRRIVLGRGLTALFTGDPGTGKTMAAQVLAHELGLDLFRVDLSRVMSKYIGETEKNLSQLFDEARASGAILFFDEADALFGKRTEVKDAHDRYANLEIGYLLQRMEEHTGTTVLATNRMRDLDEAFTRRFHFILDFPMPRPPERRRIWEGMLPREAEREPSIDLDMLARDYEISGGEIRNSVLGAAFMAAREGVPIGLRHLKLGLRRELLKTGRVLDSKQRRELGGG
jgi:hypothetical protein